MPFNIPTRREIFDQGATDIEVSLPGANPRRPRSVLGVWLTVVAGASHAMWRYLWWIVRQFFVDTAEAEFLARWATIWGVKRRVASKASGTVNFTGTDGATIPTGTLVQLTDGTEYATTVDATIVAGTASAVIEATEGGAAGNVPVNVKLSMVSPVLSVNSEVIVDVNTLSGGADEEDDDSLRRRLLLRLRIPPHGGADFDYRHWAEEVSFVREAFVFPLLNGIGTVGVTFTVNNKAATEPPIPTIAELAEVAAYIEDHNDPVTGRRTGRPVTADVSVFAPTTHAIEFDVSLSPNDAATQAAVEAELRDFIERSQQPGIILRVSNIREAISASVGEGFHDLNMPAADVQLAAGAIPVFDSIFWRALP